jgi:hypothetical protein
MRSPCQPPLEGPAISGFLRFEVRQILLEYLLGPFEALKQALGFAGVGPDGFALRNSTALPLDNSATTDDVL